jgi:poly(3-hydroxybutyrate) depolymerase
MAKCHYDDSMQKTLPLNTKKSNFKNSLLRTVVLLVATIFFFSSTLQADVRAKGKGTTSDPFQKPGTVKNHTICVDGTTQRWYLLFLPSNYTTSAKQSLIVSYHGGGRNASRQLSLDNFTSPEYNFTTTH